MVRVSTKCMPIVIASATAPPISFDASMRMPPRSIVPPTRVSGRETKLALNAQNAE